MIGNLPSKVLKVTLMPPLEVAREAARGLLLHKRFRRGGTTIGVKRAVQLSRRDPVSVDTIQRMHSYFARHFVDRRPGWDDPKNPSNGYIAWLLWGGDSGKDWALRMLSRVHRAAATLGVMNMIADTKLTKGQLRKIRTMIFQNIVTHCGQIYKRGSKELEACRSAAIIAAAEVSDVFEKYGVEF